MNGARLRFLHACSAGLIAIFLAIHMINHGYGLFGEDRHIAFMHLARGLYRVPIVELPLLLLFAWQAISGLLLVGRGWRGRHGAIAWAQALSGSYLSIFLLIHISAVLNGRANGIDTDVRFAGQGLHVGLAWFFIPYYGLAVTALFTHLGCALYWARGGRMPAIVGASAAFGAIFGGMILAALGGMLFPVHFPKSSTGCQGCAPVRAIDAVSAK